MGDWVCFRGDHDRSTLLRDVEENFVARIKQINSSKLSPDFASEVGMPHYPSTGGNLYYKMESFFGMEICSEFFFFINADTILIQKMSSCVVGDNLITKP